MYARFLFAIAIALSIFTVSAVTRAAMASQDSVIRVQAVAQSRPDANRGATRLPTVVVHPDALARAQSRHAATVLADDAMAVPVAAFDQAGKVLSGRVRERVARVSMLVTYYAFGGSPARKTE